MALVVCLLYAVGASACGGSSEAPTAAAPEGVTPVASAVDRVEATSTMQAKGSVITAARTAIADSDFDSIEALLVFAEISCADRPTSVYSGPLCRPDNLATAEGLPAVDCSLRYRPRDEFVLTEFRANVLTLQGVYAPTATVREFWPDAEYVLLYLRQQPTSDPQGRYGFEVILSKKGIVGLHYGCGKTPEDLALFHRLLEPVQPPE